MRKSPWGTASYMPSATVRTIWTVEVPGSPAGAAGGTAGGGSSSWATSRQRMRKCAATSATAGPCSRTPTSCQPSLRRAGCSETSKRSPARSVRSMPPTNAISSSTTIVFSWWQWTGCSRGSGRHWMAVSRVSLATSASTSLRVGWKTGTGAPAQTMTRTGTRSATSASSGPIATGSSPRTTSKCEARCQPVTCTCERAPAIASAMSGNAEAPSTSTSTRQPGRGGGSPAAHRPPAAGGSRTPGWPSRRRRRRWCSLTVPSIAAPRSASARATGAGGIPLLCPPRPVRSPDGLGETQRGPLGPRALEAQHPPVALPDQRGARAQGAAGGVGPRVGVAGGQPEAGAAGHAHATNPVVDADDLAQDVPLQGAPGPGEQDVVAVVDGGDDGADRVEAVGCAERGGQQRRAAERAGRAGRRRAGAQVRIVPRRDGGTALDAHVAEPEGVEDRVAGAGQRERGGRHEDQRGGEGEDRAT